MKAFFFEVDRPERLMEGGIADSTGLSHTEKLITLRDNGLTLHKLLKPGAFHQLQPDVGLFIAVVVVKPSLVCLKEHISGISA